MLLCRAAAAAGLLLGAVNAIPTISAIGSKFFDSTGKQFFIKGIAYQLTGADPLIDTKQCTLDAALMKTLGANAIRVYHVDPNATHDGCMAAFANAGIYLFVDLDTFNTALSPEGTHFNDGQFLAYSKVMDAFHQYDNTLGFFIGNEVIDSSGQSLASPYIKVAARDMKAYRDSKGYRKIPIGYSAADISQLRPMLQDYLVCGGVPADNVDFFGLNAYEWCGTNTYSGSGYKYLNEMAQGYPVPIFFSETGCMVVTRTFGDQSAILGPDMSDTWSGAIIYEWIEEINDYGLISYGPQQAESVWGNGVEGGFTRSGTPTPYLPDFTNLQSVWATLSPTGIPQSLYNANQNITTPPCPTSTPGGWLVNGNPPLPGRDATLGAGPAPTALAMTSETSIFAITAGPTASASSSAASSIVPRAVSGSSKALWFNIGAALCAGICLVGCRVDFV